MLMYYATRILSGGRNPLVLAALGLFVASLMFGAVGADIDSEQVGVTFWCLATILPGLSAFRDESQARQALLRGVGASVPEGGLAFPSS
jgi:hypothetical protein